MFKKISILFVCALLTVSMNTNTGMSGKVKAQPTPSSALMAIADNYVDGIMPDRNFGLSGTAIIRDAGGSESDKYAFFKFDVSQLDPNNIDNVVLKLYVSDITPNEPPLAVSVYAVSDDSWSETGLNWNNKPVLGDKISSASVDTVNQWISFNVSEFVKNEINGDGTVTLAVRDDTSANKAVRFHTRNNNSNQPVLEFLEIPPSIAASTPANHSEYVTVELPEITVVFDSVMDQSTLNSSTINLINMSTGEEVSYHEFSSTPTSFTMSVPEKLSYSTSYMVNVNAEVTNMRGVPLPQPASITFRTIPETNDALTTTRYTPWLVQLHMTPPAAIESGVKGGEGAQQVWAMDVDANDEQHLMISSDTTGVWASKDGGLSYQMSNNGLKLPGTVDLAISPDNGDLAFVAATAGKPVDLKFPSVYQGIWKTTDRGASWQHVLELPYHRYRSGNLIQFGGMVNGTREIFVASHGGGLFRSLDDGDTWTYVGLSGLRIGDLHVDAAIGRIIAATEENGVMVSNDHGETWESFNHNLPTHTINGESFYQAYGIAVNPLNASNWVLAAGDEAYISYNSGVEWQKLPRPSGVPDGKQFIKVLFGPSPVTGNHPRLFLVMDKVAYNVRYSDDLGQTWNKLVLDNSVGFTKEITGYSAEGIVVHPTDPNLVWTSLNMVMFKSTDGGTSFHYANSGYSGFRASDFLFDPADSQNIYIAVIDRGIAASVNPGKQDVFPMFEDIIDPKVMRFGGATTVHSITRDPENPGHLWINIGDWNANTILAESWDYGKTFQHIPGTEGASTKLIQYHPQQPDIIYAGSRYSSDGGATWTQRTKSVVAVSPFNGDYVWAIDRGTDAITQKMTYQLYHSTDGGITWTLTAPDIMGMSNSTPIRKVVPDENPEYPNRFWVASDDGIYRFDGSSYSYIGEENGLQRNVDGGLQIFDIAQNPNRLNHYVAGGYNIKRGVGAGLFQSFDGGVTWSSVPGLPSGAADIWKLAFHPTLPHVYIGTSAGTWVYQYENLNVEAAWEYYMSSGDVVDPLAVQLDNTLNQAQHHLQKGSSSQAISFMTKFINHVENVAMHNHITNEAKDALVASAKFQIVQWSLG
ncbi:CBM96 family carbohydrate-binding protein [Paenibacillus chungangensis]|uniref:DNRLRE domain-containing protein n=1 Tax=Paenibacillus chungangensis TaxID=696535 RepID=A0ABW3HR83_9BACL